MVDDPLLGTGPLPHPAGRGPPRHCATRCGSRSRPRAWASPVLGVGAPRRPRGRRFRADRARGRHRRGDLAHPGRYGRGDAAQSPAAGRRRAVRGPGGPLPGPYRHGSRALRRVHRRDPARAGPGQGRGRGLRRRSWANCSATSRPGRTAGRGCTPVPPKGCGSPRSCWPRGGRGACGGVRTAAGHRGRGRRGADAGGRSSGTASSSGPRSGSGALRRRGGHGRGGREHRGGPSHPAARGVGERLVPYPGEFPPLRPVEEIAGREMTDRERALFEEAQQGHIHGTEAEVGRRWRRWSSGRRPTRSW